MKNSFVTVYMPVFNASRFIKLAIDSVLKQSHKNLELLIIDDGSTDGSIEMLNLYEDEECVRIYQQKNIGLNATINRAIDLAKGEFIMRLDPDDILLPDSVELLLTELVENDQNGFVFGNYDVIDRFGNKWYSYEYSAVNSLRLDPPLGACTMFRRSVLKKVGGYFEEFDCQDGHDIWLKCRETVKYAIVKRTIFQYRRHKNNLTNSACRLLDTRYKIYERHNAGRDKKKQNYYVVIPIHDESDESFIDPFLVLGERNLIEWTLDESISVCGQENTLVLTNNGKVSKFIRDAYPQVKIFKRSDIMIEGETFSVRKIIMCHIDIMLESTVRKSNELNSALFINYLSTPFRQKKHMRHAIDLMEIYSLDRVVSADPLTSDLHICDAGVLTTTAVNGTQSVQENAMLCRPNYVIDLVKIGYLKSKTGESLTGRMEIAPDHSMKLNSEFDVQVAKMVAKKYG